MPVLGLWLSIQSIAKHNSQLSLMLKVIWILNLDVELGLCWLSIIGYKLRGSVSENMVHNFLSPLFPFIEYLVILSKFSIS